MIGRKNRALEVSPVVPYKALEKFPKALYGTKGGTCSARFFRPVMSARKRIRITTQGFPSPNDSDSRSMARIARRIFFPSSPGACCPTIRVWGQSGLQIVAPSVLWPKMQQISHLIVPKFAIGQSEAVSAAMISCDFKSLTWWLRYQGHLIEFWSNIVTMETTVSIVTIHEGVKTFIVQDPNSSSGRELLDTLERFHLTRYPNYTNG